MPPIRNYFVIEIDHNVLGSYSAAIAESGHSSTLKLDLANQEGSPRTSASMDIDDIHDEDPSLSAPSFRPRGTSDRSIDSGYYSNTSVGDTVALIDSRMRPLPSSSEPDHPFNASYQDFHFDSTAHNEQGPIRYENSGLMEPPRYESSYGTDPAYERNGQVYDAPTRKLSVPESLSTHHPERNGQGYDAPTQEFVPESTSIPRDDKLLSFQPTIHHFTLLDRSLRTMSVSLNADLHGMFFITDPQNPPGLLPELNPSEITCYRRNLFQVTGSITLSRGLLYILTNRGDRIPIVAQELTISVTESIENNTVKLISVPWKTPKEPAEKIEKEPSVLPLDLICHHDSDAEVATIPFAWKRLQFRIATVNNARRPELQQNFVVRLKLMVTLSTGDTTVVAEARSAAIIVRGRSPRNFQQRQDLPVIVEKVHEKPHPQIWPSECSNDIPEASQSVTAEDRTLIGHGLEGFAHSHDSDEISRLSNALAYSTDSATGVSSPMKGANRVPHKCSAAHAEVTTVLESLTAFRHPVNEDEENCGSSTSANGQPQTAFAQDLASDKDGNGHLSDEYEGSLSANEHSVKSGSENEYDSTSEGSVLNCSQRALISRLMDEICSLFFSQVSHRPRQRGQDGQGARDSSSDTTERTITSNHSSNQSSVSRRKRIHEDDEDPADEDNDEHKRRKTQDSNDVPSTRERYFACPFHKFDASIYGNGNEDPRLGLKYRSCGPPGWRTIGKLK